MGNTFSLTCGHCVLQGSQVVALQMEEKDNFVVLNAAFDDRTCEQKCDDIRYKRDIEETADIQQFFLLKKEGEQETLWKDACRSLLSFIEDKRSMCLLYVQEPNSMCKVVIAIESSVFPRSMKQKKEKRLYKFGEQRFLETDSAVSEANFSDFDTYYHLLHNTELSSPSSGTNHGIYLKRLQKLVCDSSVSLC